MDEPTTKLTDDALRPVTASAELGLHLAWHEEAERVGRAVRVPAREGLELGRGGSAFGPGALDARKISRRHARFTLHRGVPVVEDLGSSNGTQVNGEPLEGPRVLAPGDVVQVGSVLLVVAPVSATRTRAARPEIVGDSPALGEVLRQLASVAPRMTPVLLLGETGVGKELFARELHERSGRRGRLVAVNCGAVADTLLQSELFGHRRGAFSGAQRDREGLVEEARGGTLFLDEIGDASPSLQVQLLRLLQEGEYRPVGEDRVRKADIRVVAATHKDLTVGAADGSFRRDLLARLGRWIVRIPPLRDRRSDVPVLVRTFAARHAGRDLWTDRPLMLRLLLHPWPSNVRELDAVVERLCIEAGDGADRLGAAPWLDDVLGHSLASAGLSAPGSARPAPARTATSPRPYFKGERPTSEELTAALTAAGGRIKAMARELGISRRTAYRWLQDAGIDVDAIRDGGD